LTFFLTAIAMISCWTTPVNAAEKDFPFRPGERLTYQLKWSFVTVGEAVLEVLPVETVNGLKAYHFVLTAQTNSLADHFYKVRDRIDAYTDLEITRSILYIKKQREGKTHGDVVVNFDWKKMTAQYANFNKKKDPISILPGSFDPLSILFYARLVDIKENEVFKRPVTDGKKCITGIASIIRREEIKLASGTYDTYLVEPDLEHIGGVFKKSKNAKIQVWITADKRRIPVMVKSKVVVGSFRGELTSAIGSRNP